MSSFYDIPIQPTPPRIQLKLGQKAFDHSVIQINNGGMAQTVCGGGVGHTASGNPGNTQRHKDRQFDVPAAVTANTPATTSTTTQLQRQSPTVPPLRRVVKFSIQPHVATIGVALCALMNTILCIVFPSTITPLLGTQWGSFLYLWLLITIMQLVTHSVYLCTPTARFASVLHLSTVALSAVLLPRSMFARYLWIAPCLCIVLVSYQVYIFCLVYTPLHNAWMYAFVGSLLVLFPMTQLPRIDTHDTVLYGTASVWSAISIFTLYAFALANSRKAVLVDVIVGTSPTSQLQE
jgi:hypothetical protein